MKIFVVLMIVFLVVGPALAFCPMGVDCPIHDHSRGYKQGNDVWVDGKWIATYKCNFNGHLFQMVCR